MSDARCYCHCEWNTFALRPGIVTRCGYCDTGVVFYGGEVDFVIGECSDEDREMFFGVDEQSAEWLERVGLPYRELPVIQLVGGAIDLGDLAMIARAFESKSDARRAGLFGPIPSGFSQRRIGKKRMLMAVLNLPPAPTPNKGEKAA